MISAIIAAGGKGERFGDGGGKQFAVISGKPLLHYTLRPFFESDKIKSVILAVSETKLEAAAGLAEEGEKHGKDMTLVAGGAERQDSVANALKKLPQDCRAVMVHDGARPLVTRELLERLIDSLEMCDGAVTGIPAVNTMKKVRNGLVEQTLDRSDIWEIQTPQIFRRKALEDAYFKAFSDTYYATDDAGLLERCGFTVKAVMGESSNIKVTYPEDLLFVRAVLEERGQL